MDRKTEIRRLLKLSSEEVRAQAGHHLDVCEDLDALHRRFDGDIAAEIQANNSKKKQTRLILPVGPTGQYPILAEIINSEKISLSECWFFFMDENCGDDGKALGREHPLSFKGETDRLFLSRLDDSCRLQSERVIFPDENNISTLATRIDELGGIDTSYGGIGIHVHVVFIEPAPGIKDA
jgi:glucosamine-6-phosphate deaminase